MVELGITQIQSQSTHFGMMFSVDTKILVKHSESGNWRKRYFAKCENNKIYSFDLGKTSWSNDAIGHIFWEYAKLYNEKED